MSKFSPLVLRTFNNYDTAAASDAAALVCSDASKTQQHFRDECDINTIVERFGLTGQLPQNVRAPVYGDFTHLSDFRNALDAIKAADESFMQMPAAVRYRFSNDPAQFVDFCSNPANYGEMEALGLLVPKAPASPTSSVTPAPQAPLQAPQGPTATVSAS